MPPLPDAPKVLRIEFNFSLWEDLHGKCRMFYAYTGTAPSNPDLNEFCDDIRESMVTNVAPLCCNDVSWTSITATDLTSSTAAFGENTTALAGTRGSTVLTADVCAVLQRKVARRYRGGHPRVYWPFGITTDLHDGQTWNETARIAFISGLGQLDTDIAGAGWSGAGTISGVNVSYYSGFTVVTGPTGRARNVSTKRVTPIIDPVVQLQVPAGIGTQRRRMLHLA